MKKLLLLATAVLISFNAAYSQKTLPDVDVINSKNETVSIRSVVPVGTPSVVSFWDTACKPCLQELGALSDVYDEWKEELKFEIIAVSTDDVRSSSKAIPLAEGRGWPFTIVLDRNGDVKRAMNVQSNPTVFILDGEGKVVYTHVGYTHGSEKELYEVLKKLQ